MATEYQNCRVNAEGKHSYDPMNWTSPTYQQWISGILSKEDYREGKDNYHFPTIKIYTVFFQNKMCIFKLYRNQLHTNQRVSHFHQHAFLH